MPKVSVIIPTYNMARFLPEAIESVFNQTFEDYEVIVLDDGSTDNTKDIVEEFNHQFWDKIRYIYQENSGLAIARNVAIKHSTGEFIALLDADDKYYPNRLEMGVNVLAAYSDVGLVHANDMAITEDGEEIEVVKRRNRLLSGYIFKELYTRKANISCPTVLVRRECFNRVGVFDENLTRLGCEDREMWLRIAHEYRILHIDKVLAYYRRHARGMSKNREKMLNARYYVAEKFYRCGYVSRSRRNRALSFIHRQMGDEFFKDSGFKEAKLQYLKAMYCWPLTFWPWVNFLRTLYYKEKK
jgi:glycosyltransferase involved in cell wall biosynthesis